MKVEPGNNFTRFSNPGTNPTRLGWVVSVSPVISPGWAVSVSPVTPPGWVVSVTPPCGSLQQKMFLCGECEEGYGLSANSFNPKCANNCSRVWSTYALPLCVLGEFAPTALLFISLVAFLFQQHLRSTIEIHAVIAITYHYTYLFIYL